MRSWNRIADWLRPALYFGLKVNVKAQHHWLERYFLPARRYASAGLCDSDVSVRLSVCLSVCLSHAGIVPSRAKAGS